MDAEEPHPGQPVYDAHRGRADGPAPRLRFAGRGADEALAAGGAEHGIAGCGELPHAADELVVLGNALAEAQPGIDDDRGAVHAAVGGRGTALQERRADVRDDVAVLRLARVAIAVALVLR